MSGCKHANLQSGVNVKLVEDGEGNAIPVAQVRVRCRDCGTRFRFIGQYQAPPKTMAGVASGPHLSDEGQILSAPMEPAPSRQAN